MNDLISRKALLDWYSPYAHTDENIPFDTLIDDVMSMPTVGAVPVRHGRWIETSEGTFCSECNKNPIQIEHYMACNFNGNFCQNCGADMR